MSRDLRDILGGFLILIVAFSNSVYFMVLGALGMGRNQVLFHVFHLVVAVLGVIYFLVNQKRLSRKIVANTFAMIIVVIVLFFLTRFLYGYTMAYYQTLFISLFARFVPSVLVGTAMLGDTRSLHKIERALPIFVVFFTAILARYIFSAQIGVNIANTFDNEAGLSYQSLSYYSTFMYGFAMYLVSCGKMPRFWKVMFLSIGLLCMVLCVMTGGRGAFVLAVVFTLYFFRQRLSVGGIIVSMVLFVGAYLLVAHMKSNELFNQGSRRLLDFFSSSDAIENDIRWERWGLAWKSFLSSPLFGHGLGSVFYEVGMYSHNILTDMLCEGGVLLVGFFVANLTKFTTHCLHVARTNVQMKIIVVIFLCAFVLLCFSGYYLSEESIWLAMAYVLPQRESQSTK